MSRQIAKEHRKAQAPHGKQSVKKLMGHGGATSSIELSGATRHFDRVARKWGVDYAFRRVDKGKYLLLFKANQADAITGCFAEYSRKELNRAKSRRTPIREQLNRAEEQARKQPQREYGVPGKSQDFLGRGGATERADFGGIAAEGAERSLCRRKEAVHGDR